MLKLLLLAKGLEPKATLGINPGSSQREYYASLDINLRKIKTNSKFLDKTLKILSFIKVPMPAFKFSQNKINFYPFHYGQ